MGSKKTTTQNTNQTQTAAPPSWTLPGLQYAGNQVTNALQQNGSGPAYTGDFVATMDPARVAAQVAAYDRAATEVGGLAEFSQQQMQEMFQPRDMSAELDAAISAAIDPVYRQLQEQVLPGITNSALASGAYTNDRALGVVPQTAIRDATENAQRLAATMGYEGLQAEEDRRLQRGAMLPELTNLVAQMFASRGDVMSAGTTLDQQLRQSMIDNNLARHNYDVNAPYERIAPAAQLLTMLSQGWGTNNMTGQSTTVEKTGGLGPMLQGVMGLGSMAASLGAFGPLGLAAGAAGGAAPAAAAIAPVSNLFRFPPQ